MSVITKLCVAVLIVVLANAARAEDAKPAGEESSTDLAKKTQNPVADLISVPFQNNFNLASGPNDKSVWVLNIQPVIPYRLTEEWNLITRVIVPIGTTTSPRAGTSRARRSSPPTGRQRAATSGLRLSAEASADSSG